MTFLFVLMTIISSNNVHFLKIVLIILDYLISTWVEIISSTYMFKFLLKLHWIYSFSQGKMTSLKYNIFFLLINLPYFIS